MWGQFPSSVTTSINKMKDVENTSNCPTLTLKVSTNNVSHVRETQWRSWVAWSWVLNTPSHEKVMTTIALFFCLDQVQDFLVLLIPVRVFLVFIPSHQACFLMEPKTKRRRNVGHQDKVTTIITTGCCSDRWMFRSGQQCQMQSQQEALNCKITKSINLCQVKLK